MFSPETHAYIPACLLMVLIIIQRVNSWNTSYCDVFEDKTELKVSFRLFEARTSSSGLLFLVKWLNSPKVCSEVSPEITWRSEQSQGKILCQWNHRIYLPGQSTTWHCVTSIFVCVDRRQTSPLHGYPSVLLLRKLELITENGKQLQTCDLFIFCSQLADTVKACVMQNLKSMLKSA